MAAQVLGAIVGAWLLTVVVPDAAQGNLGAHGLGADVTVGAGLIAEIILTFALVFVVLRPPWTRKVLATLLRSQSASRSPWTT